MKVAAVLFKAKKAAFMAGIFGPVLGLTALSRWAAVLPIPTLAYLLLSGYEPQYSFATQYSAPLVALVLGTSVLALASLAPAWQPRVMAAVIVSSLVFSFLFGDLPFSRHFNFASFAPEARYGSFVGALGEIPAGASVASQDGLTSHLDQRRFIYSIGFQNVDSAQYVVLDYASDGRDLSRHRARVSEVEAMGYDLVAVGDGLALLKRR